MAHLQVAAPQVVVTLPIAVHIQVDHQPHAAIHRVQVRAHLQIVANAVTVHVTPVRLPIARPVHMVTEIHAHLHVHHQIAGSVVTVHVTPVRLQIVPIVRPVHTATEIHAHLQDHLQIAANAVTVHVIPVQVQIVRHVLMVIDQNAVMIVVQVPIDQQVVRMVIATPVQVPVHRPIVVIVQLVVHTETETHVRLHVQVQIVQVQIVHVQIVHVVARRVDRQIDAMTVILDRAIHDPRQINPAEVTHTVAIVHVQAMIATPVRLRVTANAVAVQIVPEVASPMIAKNVHAVVLAKSA
jgi:hypothetical protein